jgi:hypothetical protein
MAKRLKHPARLGQVLARPGACKEQVPASASMCSRCWRGVLDGGMSEWLSTDDPRLSRIKQKREAILAEVGHTHLATVYWPGDKGPWHTTYDKKPLNGQVTRWQVWIGEDGARRRILG